jgi:phage-related protein
VGDADEGKKRDFACALTASSRRVVILRVFIKKTERTPRHEIDLALSRARLIKAMDK